MPERATIALPAMAGALRSCRSRRCQSFNRINTMPLFCARPEKPTPVMVMTVSTASFSFSIKYFSICFVTASVCSSVEPTGIITCASKIPWSSSGRYAVGMRRNKTPISEIITINTERYRFFREREWLTSATYRSRIRRNMRSNHKKKGFKKETACSAGS